VQGREWLYMEKGEKRQFVLVAVHLSVPFVRSEFSIPMEISLSLGEVNDYST